MLFLPASTLAQREIPMTVKQYHEEISDLWNQKKAQYVELMKKSGGNPKILYNIQSETNNLLKYTGYCQKYVLLDELTGLYLRALDTLTLTDQYLFTYYPDSPKNSVHKLKKKYRMWVDKRGPIGQENILESAQFLYLLSDTINIIADIAKDKRTPTMNEGLNKFVPVLLGHYDRWMFDTPGPFQVRSWGCRYDGKYTPTGMNHSTFLKKKIQRKLGNGSSPEFCNAVQDIDMWMIAGVANVLMTYKKDKQLVPVSDEEYKKLLTYLKDGVQLLESRIGYTMLNSLAGKPTEGAIFEIGVWDKLPSHEFAAYTGTEFPDLSLMDKTKYVGRNIGWDLNHARRFVHVFSTLLKSKDIFSFDFPTKELVTKLANQLIYAVFNRDFKKPLFANYMDGTNGWYRINYSGKSGFGYGPWDMSVTVLTVIDLTELITIVQLLRLQLYSPLISQ